MTEERTTVTETPDGNTHTRTTIVSDDGKGGAGKWIFLGLLVVGAVVAVIMFDRLGGAEIAKDDAIASAANEVGEAAGQVGDAAEDIADNVTGGE